MQAGWLSWKKEETGLIANSTKELKEKPEIVFQICWHIASLAGQLLGHRSQKPLQIIRLPEQISCNTRWLWLRFAARQGAPSTARPAALWLCWLPALFSMLRPETV